MKTDFDGLRKRIIWDFNSVVDRLNSYLDNNQLHISDISQIKEDIDNLMLSVHSLTCLYGDANNIKELDINVKKFDPEFNG